MLNLLSLNVFWLLTIVCCALALSTTCLPIWSTSGTNNQHINFKTKMLFSIVCGFLLCSLCYGIYYKLGSAHSLQEYYSAKQQQQRAINLRLQPLYARLQRELIKAQYNHAIDPANEQLVINFANIHAQMNDGELPEQVLTMLENILKSHPNRGNILNLLAVHHYKTKNYALAAMYWNNVLVLIPDETQYLSTRNLLKSKIATTELLVRTQT